MTARHYCSLAPPGAAAESEASGCTRQILSRVNARKKKSPHRRFVIDFYMFVIAPHGSVKTMKRRPRGFFSEFQVVVPLHFHYVVTRFPLRLPWLEEPRAASAAPEFHLQRDPESWQPVRTAAASPLTVAEREIAGAEEETRSDWSRCVTRRTHLAPNPHSFTRCRPQKTNVVSPFQQRSCYL